MRAARLLFVLIVTGASAAAALGLVRAGPDGARAAAPVETDAAPQDAPKKASGLQTAVFAGGCFWCTEADFEKIDGVVEAVSGYTGGRVADPTYRQVTSGGTGHYEAVQVTYDPAQISYPTLVAFFLRTIDPTDPDGQFCDKGESYRTAIFAANDQRAAAEAALGAVVDSGRFETVATVIAPRATFYEAEGYHQDFYKTNPGRYGSYRFGCQRDARLSRLWGEEAGGAAVLARAADAGVGN